MHYTSQNSFSLLLFSTPTLLRSLPAPTHGKTALVSLHRSSLNFQLFFFSFYIPGKITNRFNSLQISCCNIPAMKVRWRRGRSSTASSCGINLQKILGDGLAHDRNLSPTHIAPLISPDGRCSIVQFIATRVLGRRSGRGCSRLANPGPQLLNRRNCGTEDHA